MKKLIIAVIAIFIHSCVFAQENAENITHILIVDDSDFSDIHDIAELDQSPEFPGGIDGLMEFLSQNIVYRDKWAEQEF